MPSSFIGSPFSHSEPLIVLLQDLDAELQQQIDNDSDTWSDNMPPMDNDEDSVSSNKTDGSPPDVLSSPQSPDEPSTSSDPVPMNLDQAGDTGNNFEPVHYRRDMRRVRLGRNVARRGRRRVRASDDDTQLTPFERGLTFNGFARNLEPEAVTGFTLDIDDGILYSVKWRNFGTRSRQIESSLMRLYRPDMLIDYYEAVAKRNVPP